MADSQNTTLKDKFGDDDWVLRMCADWRAERAQMQKNWAEHNLANGWGTLPDPHTKLDSDPLERMQRLEELLSMAKPFDKAAWPELRAYLKHRA